MRFSKTVTLLIMMIFSLHLFSQIDGDNIFAKDQIITIDLTFLESDFWEVLETNYETKSYLEADLTITDSTGTILITNVGVRLKGNSSYLHPGNKKSFKIDFNEYVSGQNYDGLKKLNFNNGFKDPALIREKLFFDLCRDAGVPAPRTNFANVYFNGILWGFYTVVEQIDDQFLDWRLLDDDGNLFKAGDNFQGSGSEADLSYYGDSQNAYEDRYELKSNEIENDWIDLIELVDFINNSTSSVFETELENQIELQEYLRSAAIDNIFSNLDSYTLSARNYYIYHNQTSNKWEWIKWDANMCFGTYSIELGPIKAISLPLNYVANNRPLLENIFNSSILYSRYLQELRSITEDYFNPTYLNSIIYDYKTLIQNSVYADENKMYSNSDFDTNIENNIIDNSNNNNHIIYGLKSFVQEKSSFILNELNCKQAGGDSLEVNFSMIPNPANNRIEILSNHQLKSITIYNMLGEKVLKQFVNSMEISIDVNHFSDGIYLAYFESGFGCSISKKFIIKQ